MKRDTMQTFAIRLPAEAREFLKTEAHRRGVTESRLVRQAIAKHLTESNLRGRPMEANR
jgi:predicted DNA-binding protein